MTDSQQISHAETSVVNGASCSTDVDVTRPVTKSELPFVSVVMPVRNEGDYMHRSLGSVLKQDYPLDHMEILIADGMSTDTTRKIIQEYQQTHPNILLLDNPGKIVPTGMNVSLPRCRGTIVVRIDGHCEIAPDYVRRCVEHIEQDGVDGVGGSIETINETFWGSVVAVAMSTRFGVGGSAFRTLKGKTVLADTIPFPAYTAKVLASAGPYDEELVRNQDDEYNYRLRSQGAKLLLSADVQSRYYARTTLYKLWRQYYQYGFWKVRVMQKHPRQMSLRQFVPPVFVATILVLSVASIFSTNARVALAAIAMVYLLANCVASLIAAWRHQWRQLPLLPLAYAVLHFAYGSGFLVGLVHFANRWSDRSTRVPGQF